MNIFLTTCKRLAAIALVALAAGCATGNPANDDIAIAAGFKIITPLKADQKAIVAKLPSNKVTPVTYHGATYFVMPDTSNGMVLVGNSAQYSVYQQMRMQKQLSNENLEAAQMNEMNSMDWGGWGGADLAFAGGFVR
jgi:hypothetical protein